MSINVGSTIGTILTPIFRSDIKCFEKDCYPLGRYDLVNNINFKSELLLKII
jgi:hypothetical protein